VAGCPSTRANDSTNKISRQAGVLAFMLMVAAFAETRAASIAFLSSAFFPA
jgi:hypothetical protein